MGYTDTSIATTGLTADQAREQGLDVKQAKFPLAANGRAVAMGAQNGFMRIVYIKESGVIVGAQMVGVHVSEIISEMTLAIESGATVDDIALTIHPHPSVSESVQDAADVATGYPTNI